MPEKERNNSAEVPRRKFLKDAGLIVGGAATLGVGALALTGCEAGATCPTASAANQADVEYFGECICPRCGNRQPHPRGVPCRLISCPDCGEGMGRAAV